MKKLRFCLIGLLLISLGFGGWTWYSRYYAPDMISVLIPTYNVDPYIDECISSVLNQTYKNLQIIVVDDGSTDGTYEKLQTYAQKDKRIELYHHVPNQGAAITREETLSHVKGKYLIFVDSDDYISPTFVAHMARQIRRSKTNFVINNTVIVKKQKTGKENELWWTQLPGSGLYHIPPECMWFQWALWGKIFDANFIKRIDLHFPRVRHNTDLFSHAVIVSHTQHIYITDGPAYYHRIRPNSLQTEKKGDEQLQNSLRVNEAVFDYLKENNLLASAKPNVSLMQRETLDAAQLHESMYPHIRRVVQKIKPDVWANSHLYDPEEMIFIKRVVESPTYTDYFRYSPEPSLDYWNHYRKTCGPKWYNQKKRPAWYEAFIKPWIP